MLNFSIFCFFFALQSTDKARHAAYEPDLYMAALDVLAGLADGLRASLDPLLAAKPITPALLLACGDEVADVRQSAFALLGDLARGCPAHVMDKFSELVGLGLASLEAPMLVEQNMVACNNATWSMGELVIKVRSSREGGCLFYTEGTYLRGNGRGQQPGDEHCTGCAYEVCFCLYLCV